MRARYPGGLPSAVPGDLAGARRPGKVKVSPQFKKGFLTLRLRALKGFQKRFISFIKGSSILQGLSKVIRASQAASLRVKGLEV